MSYNSKYTGQQVEALLDIVSQGGSSGGEGGTITEAELLAMGFTKNLGTITEVKMNGASKGTSGVVDLGKVITEHQDISGKQDKIADLDAIRQGASLGATALQSIPSEYVTESDLDNKVDKIEGKGLSTEDFTSALKSKLEGLSNYNDTEIASAVSSLQTQINTLVSGNADDAINSFNEVIAFLDGIQDTQDLSSIIASIEQQVAGKMDKVTLATVATSGDYNDLNNKPAIPTKTSDLTNDSGFITANDNAASATKLANIRYLNGVPFDGSANAINYAVCSTPASTTAKTVSISRFSLVTGAQVRVEFDSPNTASAPTLNVGSTGAKRMSYKGSLITNTNFTFNPTKIYTFTYDGTYWVLEGDWDEAPKTFRDLTNNNFITCQFAGEVGDVIWSDDDQNRIEHIENWIDELGMGKVCVLDYDEDYYSSVIAFNFRTDANFGMGRCHFSYIFDGYLYDVEYESVSLPITLTIVGKTKLSNADKQDKLVSGTSIKTINNQSILGSGNISIDTGITNLGFEVDTLEGEVGDTLISVDRQEVDNEFTGFVEDFMLSDVIKYIYFNDEPRGFAYITSWWTDYTVYRFGYIYNGYIYEIEFKDDQWVEFKIINKLKLSNNEGGGSSSGESKEIVRTTDSVIESLEPNKIYIATPLSGQLTIESIESPTGIYAEYSVIICLDMISTENMSLVLPSDVMWANGELPDTTKYSTYELSIVYWSGGGAYGFNAVLTPFDFV